MPTHIGSGQKADIATILTWTDIFLVVFIINFEAGSGWTNIQGQTFVMSTYVPL